MPQSPASKCFGGQVLPLDLVARRECKVGAGL